MGYGNGRAYPVNSTRRTKGTLISLMKRALSIVEKYGLSAINLF